MPALPYQILIYSNDGTTLLKQFFFISADPSTLTVTDSGATVTSYGVSEYYTYDGEGTFLGFSKTLGSSTVDVSIGQSIQYPENPVTETFNLYIVEELAAKPIVCRILYGDTVIAELAEGETATLNTEGKIANEDIVIERVSAVSLISFTIGRKTYQAEEGMNWAKWCNSAYNTDNFYVYTDNRITYTGDGMFVNGGTQGDYELSSFIIQDGYSYYYSF